MGGGGLQEDSKKVTCEATFALFEMFCLGHFYPV